MEKIGKSGFAEMENGTETLDFLPAALGQSYPQHYPQPHDALGEPLSILEVARLLGCSDWTVLATAGSAGRT